MCPLVPGDGDDLSEKMPEASRYVKIFCKFLY